MALYDLNQYPSTSVVSLLKERGFQPSSSEQFPFYDLRSQLFSKSGLTPTEKEFRGTATENEALRNLIIQQEKKAGVSVNPNNIWQVLGYSQTPPSTGLRASVSD